MSTTQTYTGTLTVIACANCGMNFGMMKSFNDARRDDHKSFYCPAGHCNYFPGKSDLEQEREARKRAESTTAFWREQEAQRAAEAKTSELRRRATKAVLTKTRKRIANGVCPGCNRTFADLARHMRTKHPSHVGGE